MVTRCCGISTAFWGFFFHSEWVEQPVLSQQPPIRGEGLPSALPLLFSCLSLILHLCLGKFIVWRGPRFNAVVVVFLCLERRSLAWYLEMKSKGILVPVWTTFIHQLRYFCAGTRRPMTKALVYGEIIHPLRRRTKSVTPLSFWILRTNARPHNSYECVFAIPAPGAVLLPKMI